VADEEDGETLAVLVELGEKEMLMAVLVRLAAIEADEPAEVIEDPRRRKAPKRLVAERDA
jgi:hypothetical protein